MNAKTIKTDNKFTWFTNLATSTAERERIFYYEKKPDYRENIVFFVV